MRAALLLVLVLTSGCRIRTRYDGAATTACNDKSMNEGRELLAKDPLAVKKICDACCHDRGLSSVEPGSCACGDLGLDALFK